MWLNKFGIYIIICFAFIVRLISLNQSLWWDEAINVVYARQNDFWWFVTKYPLGDFHPPGYFAILWIWGHIFGFSEISVRMPSVIFGVATVYITYLIGKEIFSKKVGLIAAIFLAVAPLHIYYSQEARMYSFAAFAAVLSTFYLIRLLNKNRYGFLGFTLSISLLLYSDYVAYFLLPTQFIFVLIFYRKQFKRYVLSTTLGCLALLPWMFIFPSQLLNGQSTASIISGWQQVVGGTSIKNIGILVIKIFVGRISIYDKKLYLLALSVLAMPYTLTLIKLIRSKLDIKMWGLLIWLILPPMLALIFSFYIPVFSYFRFLFILPPFYLLLAIGIGKWSKRWLVVVAMTIFLAELIPSSIYLFENKFHREDWKRATSLIQNNLNDQNVVLFEYNGVPATYMYYAKSSKNTITAFKKVPALSVDDLNDLPQNLQGKKKIFVFEYLKDITDPGNILPAELEKLGYNLIKTYDFQGVGFVREYLLRGKL